MKNFVNNIISAALEVIMWITLIACVIGGAYIGKSIRDDYLSVGLVIGAFAGMFINICVWHSLSLIVEIRNYVKKIAEKDGLRENREEQECVRENSEAQELLLGSFTDTRDGKTYKTVTIGKQTWMAENLNYEAAGSKCYYNDPANGQKYGRLYDWETAKTACPSGWHLPSDKEWKELVNFVGGDKIAGKKLKASSGWNEDGNGTNVLGFSALPGGDGSFSNIGYSGNWWTSTEYSVGDAYYWRMTSGCADVNSSYYNKSYLYSVRCLRD